MTDQNNSAHWCKAVIEQAVHSNPFGAQPVPWNYQSSLNYQTTTTPAYTQANGINYSGYGGVISSTPLQTTVGVNNTAMSSSYASPNMYSAPGNAYYSTTVPSTSSTYQASYPQYGYPPSAPLSTSQTSAIPGTAAPTPPSSSWNTINQTITTVKPPQLNQSNVSQPVVYQAPATIVAQQTKKPNPNRFTVNSPTTIISSEPEKPASSSSDLGVSTKLRDFIKRSLASCGSQHERDAMQTVLGKLVTKYRNDKKLDSHDWDREPIPIINLTPVVKTVNLPSPVVQAPSVEVEPETAAKKRKSRWEPDRDGNIALSEDSPMKKKDATQMQINIPAKPIIEASFTPEESAMRQQRASRFQFDTKVTVAETISKKNSKKKEATIKYRPPVADINDDFDIESLKIVGTCQVLEKDYFRLTSAPDPSTVRPLDILKQSLALIKRKWKNNEVEYLYICSQLKAVRQDLTVQNIRNDFMVEVYETHARIALECGDLNEYNQCQTQLKQLYDSGIVGAEMEFTAYRILYYVYLQGNKKYQNGSSDLSGILIALSERAKNHPAVIHALTVRQNIRRENYHRFFRLYKQTPNMGAYILDHMLDGLRLQVLFRMCKSYKPHIPVSWLIDELGFDNASVGESFLIKAGCVLSDNDEIGKIVLTAESSIDPSAVLTQDKLLL